MVDFSVETRKLARADRIESDGGGGGEGAKLKRARAELKRTKRTGWQFHATRLTISISIGHRDYLWMCSDILRSAPRR